MGRTEKQAVPIVEPAYIQDILATRLARVEKLPGGLVRCVYVAEQQAYDGTTEEVVVCRLVRPFSIMADGAQLMADVLGHGWNSPNKIVRLR